MDRQSDDPAGPSEQPIPASGRAAPARVAGRRQSASLRPQNLYKVEVKVRDVSTCGFMAECAEPVRIGCYVSLDVPGIGPVHAQVRWQIGVTMGGMFLDPISLARCEWTAVKAEWAGADRLMPGQAGSESGSRLRLRVDGSNQFLQPRQQVFPDRRRLAARRPARDARPRARGLRR